MPFRYRPVLLHLKLSSAERWAWWFATLALLVLVRRQLFPADWPYEFLPFALAVPIVAFLLGRWPGFAFLPASGIAAVSMSAGPVAASPEVVTGFVLYLLHGAIICWLIDQLQTANAVYRNHQAKIQLLNDGLEQHVAERTTELLHMTEELEAFTYSLSHDLRAPIRSINATAAMMLEEQDAASKEALQEGLTKIQLSSRRMAQLMDALLSMSTTARQPVPAQSFSHEMLVKTALDSLLPDNSPRRSEIQIEALPRGVGQPQLVLQVWENLLSNALKFTGRTGAPRIVVGYEPEAKACFVHDNGSGLDMRYAERIFKPFERAHDGAQFPGTGVGLAIVDKIVRRHGGRIWCESSPRDGTTFRFTLNGMQEAA